MGRVKRGMFLKRISFRTKWWFVIGVMLFALILTTLMAVNDLNQIGDQVGGISEQNTNQEISQIMVRKNRAICRLIAIDSGIGLIILALGIIFGKEIRTLLKTLIGVSQKIAAGMDDIAVTARSQDEFGQLADVFNAIVQSNREQTRAMEAIAAGDFDIKLTSRSERDVFVKNLQKVTTNFKALLAETDGLTKAVRDGRLEVRGAAERFTGGFKELVTGFNRTLDAVTGPIDEAGEWLRKLAVNDYTMVAGNRYRGGFQEFIATIDTVRRQLLSLQDNFVSVARGDLSGLEELRRIGRRSENDRMTPAVIKMMETIGDIVNEIALLGATAVKGNLTHRGNAEKFAGDYRKMVIGLNQTLDATLAPVNETSAILRKMATGNLNVAVTGDYHGDHALLAVALNHTIKSFNEVWGEFPNVAARVTSSAKQLSDSSRVLSWSARKQASATKEIAVSMAEITARSQQDAADAARAKRLALAIREQATVADAQMRKLVEALTTISDAATGSAKIIKLVDDIARQTNVLALKAALEAASADQYGNGFAVVAKEVRNLATRDVAAAKETTGLIEDSIWKVASGAQIVNEAARSLGGLVEKIAKLTALVGEIATASEQQASGITLVNQEIGQIAQMTRNNTATAGQSAAASDELAAQAEVLKEMAAKFGPKEDLTQASSWDAGGWDQPGRRSPTRKRLYLVPKEYGKK